MEKGVVGHGEKSCMMARSAMLGWEAFSYRGSGLVRVGKSTVHTVFWYSL